MTNIRNEACDNTYKTWQTAKKIIRKYYEKLYTYKFDNSNEMDQFLANHKLPK